MKQPNKQKRSSKDFYMKFNVGDYLNEIKLVDCDAVAHGVYIKLLCTMFLSEKKGRFKIKPALCEPFNDILLKQNVKQTNEQIFKQVKNICSDFAPYVARHLKLEVAEVISGLTQLMENDVVYLEDGCICQKRMVKDFEISQKRALSGSSGGKKTQSKLRDSAPEQEILLENLLKQNLEQKEEQNRNYISNYNYNSIDKDKGELSNTRGGTGEIENGEKGEEPEILPVRTNYPDRTDHKVSFDKGDLQLLAEKKVGDDFREAWLDWLNYQYVDHNKELKSIPAKRSALDGLIMLSGSDETLAIKIIKQSMANKWARFFPLNGALAEKNDKKLQVMSGDAPIEEQRAHYKRMKRD